MKSEEAISAIKHNWPPERYTMLREALDLACSVLECFQEGDARRLWNAMRFNSTGAVLEDELAMLERLQKAAALMEAK
jgi:hypothetical protein